MGDIVGHLMGDSTEEFLGFLFSIFGEESRAGMLICTSL